MASKVETVVLKSLTKAFFVREKLDEGRVDLFMKLYESRADLPLLAVGKLKGNEAETLYLVDGRHREAALTRSGRVRAEVEIVVYDDMAEMITSAMQANYGGAMPPTEADLRHTIRLLLDQGEPRTRVYSSLAFIPASILRRLANEAEEEIQAFNMERARRAVAIQGMSVAEAAETHKVDKGKLQRKLAGESKIKPPASGRLRVALSNRFKAASPAMTRVLKEASSMYQSGELKEQDIRKLYEHARNLLATCSHIVDDFEGRFNALPKPKEAKK